ncbi:MAG: alpha/beta fold hydrolase [Planctomycetes bacterium]|nr:alpha/beta fold hydrolase [Planctomycetota bacterium]
MALVLHGIWRTQLSMKKIERALHAAGYEVVNRSYPSLRAPLPEIAARLAESLDHYRERPMFVVTHSMGGLVAREYLGRFRPANAKRLVMIAPPNQGAWLADRLNAHRRLGPAYRMLFGRNAAHLLPSAAKRAAIPRCEFGVIAGGTGRSRGYAGYLPGDNDGTVLVSETHLDGESDFLLLPRRHTFIMNASETIDAVLRFFESGRF